MCGSVLTGSITHDMMTHLPYAHSAGLPVGPRIMNNQSPHMNTPHNTVSTPKLHPLIIAAAVAVVLVSSLGAAAIMGWLPSSAGQTSEAQLGAKGQSVQLAGTAAVGTAAPAPQARRPVPVAAAGPARCAQCGVIDAVNQIDTRGQGSGLGAAGGAVVGGLLGNQVGGGKGRDLATIAGAIGGAVAGNHIEGNVRSSHSYDIVVRLNDGSMRTFHQAEQPGWRAGDQVRIVDGALRANG